MNTVPGVVYASWGTQDHKNGRHSSQFTDKKITCSQFTDNWQILSQFPANDAIQSSRIIKLKFPAKMIPGWSRGLNIAGSR